MSREFKGFEVTPNEKYTFSASDAKAVVFFDKKGKEIGRQHFKTPSTAHSFTAPKYAYAVKFLAI